MENINLSLENLHDTLMGAKYDFIPSGFESIDNVIHGFGIGDLAVIGGRPSMGKTSFAISLIKNISIERDIPCLFFTAESNIRNIVIRLVSNVSKINSENIKTSKMEYEEWKMYENAVSNIIDKPIFIDDSPYISIENLCEDIRKSVFENGTKIVVIDYIQLIYNKIGFTENRYLELNYFTRRLKSLAKELNTSIIIISQLNRNSDSDEIPSMTDLRDSGTLCEDCDLVCLLNRPDYYGRYQDNYGNDIRGIVEFLIKKNRHGHCNELISLRFDECTASFSDL